MKFSFFFLTLFVSALIFAQSTKVPKKRNPVDDMKNLSTGVSIVEDKIIETTLPISSGLRRDLYDLKGNLLQSEYFDSKGNPIEAEEKTTQEKRYYNSFGLLESIRTFDKKKKLSSHLKFLYDDNCIQQKKDETCASEISFHGSKDQPIEDEVGVHKYKTEFDPICLKNETKKPSDCKKVEIRLNKKLKNVADNDGNAKYFRGFDEFGNLNLYEVYDKFNKIKQKVIYAYDYKCIELTKKPQGCIIFHEYSNRIESENETGELGKLNYGKRVLAYDLNCIKIKKNSEKCTNLEENYDVNGNLKDVTQKFSFGCIDYSVELGAYAKKISTFDANGNEITREFYNANNQLIEDLSGAAKYVYAYNQECLEKGYAMQNCRIVSEIYDKNLKLKYKAIYDEACVKNGKANLEPTNYCTAWKEVYGSIPKKTKQVEKIRIIKANFDSDGFKTSLEQYNINHKLSIKTVYFFDKEKLVKKENQDVNGNIIEDADGIATYTYQYENEYFTTKEETFGKKGELKENSEGIARMIFVYDDNCLKRKTNRYECTKLEEFYDSQGNLVEQKSNAENTRSYAKLIREFDKNGRITQEAFFNKRGKPKKNKGGVSKYKYSYDEDGELESEEHYSKRNSLKQKIVYTYDSACKKFSKDFICNTSISYLDKNNNLFDKQKLDDIPYAKEVTSYNHTCLQTTQDPDECQEKKEYFNSKNEVIFAEYSKYLELPSGKSEIKLIKLKLNRENEPYSLEFIK